MARRHHYRYEYKKMTYLDRPTYTTDVTLRIYARYRTTDIPAILPFRKITEMYISEGSNYVIGDIQLSDLIARRGQLDAPDIFIANLSRFFSDRDVSR